MATNEKRRKQKGNRKPQSHDRRVSLELLQRLFSWLIPFLVLAVPLVFAMGSGRGADISWNNVKVHVAPSAEPSNTATHEAPHE